MLLLLFSHESALDFDLSSGESPRSSVESPGSSVGLAQSQFRVGSNADEDLLALLRFRIIACELSSVDTQIVVS